MVTPPPKAHAVPRPPQGKMHACICSAASMLLPCALPARWWRLSLMESKWERHCFPSACFFLNSCGFSSKVSFLNGFLWGIFVVAQTKRSWGLFFMVSLFFWYCFSSKNWYEQFYSLPPSFSAVHSLSWYLLQLCRWDAGMLVEILVQPSGRFQQGPCRQTAKPPARAAQHNECSASSLLASLETVRRGPSVCVGSQKLPGEDGKHPSSPLKIKVNWQYIV